MRRKISLKFVVAAVLICGITSPATAQEMPPGCVEWKTYTDTVWVEQDITENRVIHETSYETKEVTKSRPRWISEELERTVTEEKPVQQTSERVVTRTVRKPVTTTKTRIKTRVQESYEDVTEMRDETYTVRKPVTETVMERKDVLVRKPVTQRIIEKEPVTVYRPQETTQTTMVPGTLLVPGGATANARPRMRWLQRGYYSDPYSGQPVWRRTGLHWVDESRPTQAAVPVVVPQQQSSVSLVPETVVREKPVDVTRYVDEYETREVPVEVQRMVEETRTRRVPYTVRVPKRKVIEEEIPYTETTYVDETISERVPVTETVMKTVTRREPYTRIRETWEDYTETVRVPKTTTKRVPYVSKYRVPYLVQVRVPCDAAGRPVARGQQVPGTHRLHPAWKSMMTKVAGATETAGTTSETSVYERSSRRSPARFDIPGGVEAPASATSVLAAEPKAEALGEAPKVRFPNDRKRAINETSARMKTIRKPKVEPVVTGPEETEASKALSKRIEERFLKLGITPKTDPESESVEIAETSATGNDTEASERPAPATVDFEPEALSIDVEVPPAAGATSPDAEAQDDDTIEADVDLSRPTRS